MLVCVCVYMCVCVSQVSSSLLIGPDALDATITSTLALAHGVASCIYGGLMQADTSDDQWVVDGIVAHLTDKFIGAWLGKVGSRHTHTHTHTHTHRHTCDPV